MANEISCSNCGKLNPVGTKFCGGCGTPTQASNDCPECNTSNKPDAKFCRACGFNLIEAKAAASKPGTVVDGVWTRPPNEFARLVDYEDLNSAFKLENSIEIPKGSIGVLITGDTVSETLLPKSKITQGILDRFMSFMGMEAGTKKAVDGNAAFYLLDCRPFALPFNVDVGGIDQRSDAKVRVVVYAQLSQSPDDLSNFLIHTMKDKESFTNENVSRLLRPVVEANVQEIIKAQYDALGDFRPGGAQQALENVLNTVSQKQRYGFTFSTDVSVTGLTKTLTIRLGKEAEAPAMKNCVECRAEMAYAKPFCGKCGAKQPVREMSGRPGDEDGGQARAIYTRDEQQIELDIDLVVYGKSIAKLNQEEPHLINSLASSAARLLKAASFEEAASAEGFAALQVALQEAAEKTLSSVGLEVLKISVHDIRSKLGDWVLGARADMEHQKTQVQLGHEWLELGYSELELKELNSALVIKNQEADLSLAFRKDEANLADQEARKVLFDRELKLLIEMDQSEREATRTLKERDHEDTLSDRDRERDLVRGEQEFVQEVSRSHREFAQEEEQASVQHQISLEQQAADHDLTLQRKVKEQEIDLRSQEGRSAADDADYTARKHMERELEQRERAEDLDERSAERASARSERELDNEARRKLEKKQAKRDTMMANKRAKEAHAADMRDKIVGSGLSAAEMIAAQAGDLGDSKHGAAFAEQIGRAGDERIEAEKARGEAEAEKARAEAAREAAATAQRNEDKNLDRADKNLDRMERMMSQMLQSQQEVTKQAISSKTAADTGVDIDVYKEGAKQAVDMAQTSMDAMAKVASESAKQSPAPKKTKATASNKTTQSTGAKTADAANSTCIQCGVELNGNRFCQECGADNQA